MEDGIPVKISAIGATVVERREEIEFAIIRLLNLKVRGKVWEGF